MIPPSSLVDKPVGGKTQASSIPSEAYSPLTAPFHQAPVDHRQGTPRLPGSPRLCFAVRRWLGYWGSCRHIAPFIHYSSGGTRTKGPIRVVHTPLLRRGQGGELLIRRGKGLASETRQPLVTNAARVDDLGNQFLRTHYFLAVTGRGTTSQRTAESLKLSHGP